MQLRYRAFSLLSYWILSYLLVVLHITQNTNERQGVSESMPIVAEQGWVEKRNCKRQHFCESMGLTRSAVQKN